MINNLVCYVITSGTVYYVERNKMNSFNKTKTFTNGCIFLKKEDAEKVVKTLLEQDIMQLNYKSLKIHEYTLVKGVLTGEKKRNSKKPQKTKSSSPKKQDNLQMLNDKLNELNITLDVHENLEVLNIAKNSDATKVISNINGKDVKVSFKSNEDDYVAEITFIEDEMTLIIVDKESYVNDFGDEGII